ncbi:hypothetical protein IFM89_031812 [Coptis chinensis]|uniref:Uncharacterized protein n=1 Tax=Coptis chinensis TaxID=261450 RepID=A0A835HNG4_9MAGN|nr:hypothetical protein IFM89_031812 [Coptis chinensis]
MPRMRGSFFGLGASRRCGTKDVEESLVTVRTHLDFTLVMDELGHQEWVRVDTNKKDGANNEETNKKDGDNNEVSATKDAGTSNQFAALAEIKEDTHGNEVVEVLNIETTVRVVTDSPSVDDTNLPLVCASPTTMGATSPQVDVRQEKEMEPLRSTLVMVPKRAYYSKDVSPPVEGPFPRRKNVSGSMMTSLPREIGGAPPYSFVVRLSEIIGSFKTLRKMALFWCRVVTEVINCCISKKIRRSIASDSLQSIMREAGPNTEVAVVSLGSSSALYARVSTGILFFDLELINHPET